MIQRSDGCVADSVTTTQVPAAMRRGIWFVAALAVACAAEPQCETMCGTAVISMIGDVDALVPPLVSTNNGNAIAEQVFLRLADFGTEIRTQGDAGLVPELAERWEREDSRTLVFHLNPKARWHDGVPVTARDVAFTYELSTDTAVNASYAGELAAIEDVTTRDDHTVVFRFTSSYPEQLYDAAYHMRILPAHLLEDLPRSDLASSEYTRAPVGNGPYRVVRWVPGQEVDLEADPSFFLGRPGIGRIVWRVESNPDAAVSRVLSSDADVVEVLGPDANVKRASADEHLRVYDYPSSVYFFVAFNFRSADGTDAPHPLFASATVRRAVTMAVDREAIVQALFGERGAVPPGPTSRLLWVWNDDVPTIPFDSASARRLLESDGWADRDGDGVLDRGDQRLAFELLVPNSSLVRRQAAVMMQEQLRRVGIAVRITELEFLTWLEHSSQGRFDAVFGAWSQTPSPSAIQQAWTSGAVQNHGKYSSPEFDRLVQVAMAAPTMSEARNAWNRALATINADAPAIWMMTPSQTAAVNARFENVTFRPDLWAANLWQWKVDPDRMIRRDRVLAAR